MEIIKQRTAEWLKQRSGKFTASQIHRLLGKSNAKGELLKMTKQSIENYAMEKAGEMYFGLPEEEEYLSKDMQRGIDLEPHAFARFSRKMNFQFIDVFESPFIEIDKNSGASPDGKLSNGDNLEIKCPNLDTFRKFVITEKIKPQYFAQMQMQMLASGAERTHFFNYLIHNGEEYSHTIIVERCEETILLIKERIELASALRDDFFQTLKNVVK